ncbi:MAG: putative 4-hydroxybenzoate polyprenyltransferase [Treponema sp.]|jgi:4-hydroxybenzoate polyprenyltransferase|nr:putative 4-hydroxybenzoate polyprenyltransferase [Treponema sp.]
MAFLRKLSLMGDAVIFRHSLFSLPFVLTAILLESGGRPPWGKLALILAAALAGRNAANALNRVIDADIDGRNSRTAGRHIPSGRLSKKSLLLFAAALIIILIAAAALLNPLCLILLPAAVLLIGGYSFSKRFTWLCHYWLGAACACAVMGALVGLTGTIRLRYLALAGVHALWVAGFDIIYALQDIAFDRAEGLCSIPAEFGAAGGRVFAALSHLAVIGGLFLIPRFWELWGPYYTAAGIAAVLLTAEHIIALGGPQGRRKARAPDARRIRIASYSINEILPLVILAGTAVDIYAR